MCGDMYYHELLWLTYYVSILAWSTENKQSLCEKLSVLSKHLMRFVNFEINILTCFEKRKEMSFHYSCFVYPVFRCMDSLFREIVDNPLSDARYRSQWIRLSTFHNFPNTRVSSLHLAETGFYYAGNGDEVVCYACGMRHRNWTSLDNPQEVHRRLSANCPHFQEGNYNIPIGLNDDQQQIEEASDTTISSSTQNATLIDGITNSITSEDNHGVTEMRHNLASPSTDRNSTSCRISTGLVYQTFRRRSGSYSLTIESISSLNNHQPLSTSRHLNFITPEQRERSFIDGRWSELGRRQTPEQLAEAGFFFKGIDDITTCFHCGCSLRNWEPEDDPFGEHARWSPNCSFLRSKKGIQFIKNIQQRYGEDLYENRRKEIKSQHSASSQSTALVLRIRKRKNEDLHDKVENLETKVRELTGNIEDLKHRIMCKICLQEEVSIVFLPCGHLVCCATCAARFNKCPVCRKKITGNLRAVIS